MTEARCILDAKAALGESPVWSAEEQALYWADIYGPALHRLDPATGATRTWAMPQPIGSFGLRVGGGAVVALKSGFHLLDFESSRLAFLAHPEPDRPGNRLNDGKVSPEGRFWAGTMDESTMKQPSGALYRLDPDGSCHRMAEGFIVSNGLAWGPDGRTMFHSDSRGPVIWAWDYDPAGGDISNRREVARPTEAVGRPDGAACDMEGYYWSAGVSAGKLNRWAPDGRLDRQIPVPCPRAHHALLRWAGDEDDLPDLAAHEGGAGAARRLPALRRHLRARGRCPRRAGRQVQGIAGSHAETRRTRRRR